MMNRHEALVDMDAANSFDVVDPCWGACAEGFGLARAESMDVTNDPRFFAGSVMNKRLMAFKSLTIVSSLMFSTALGQCFKIKKDMNFSEWDPLVGNIAIWEFVGFTISVIVASMCLFSLYVISHQLFYTIRLTTAGPTGFEQASMFYLTRTMVVWRHLAVSCLFNGLWLFIILVGIQFFVTFYKDAIKLTDKHHQVWVSNMVNGSSVETPLFIEHSHHELNMIAHTVLGYISLAMFVVFTFVLAVVRKQHVQVFQSGYAKAKLMSDPLEMQVKAMGTRGSPGWKLGEGSAG